MVLACADFCQHQGLNPTQTALFKFTSLFHLSLEGWHEALCSSAIHGRDPERSIAYCSAIGTVTWVYDSVILHDICHYIWSAVQHYVCNVV
jgi:hypothetical protein